MSVPSGRCSLHFGIRHVGHRLVKDGIPACASLPDAREVSINFPASDERCEYLDVFDLI
jgi:hypothetical protein